MNWKNVITAVGITLTLAGCYIIWYAFDRLACNADGCGPNIVFIVIGIAVIICGILLSFASQYRKALSPL